MRDIYKQIAELGFLALAFFLAIPPVSSTTQPNDLMPDLAFAGVAYAGSLGFAMFRKAETWIFAAAKLMLFLIFASVLHLRVGLGA